MKLLIEVTEDQFDLCKKWKENGVANIIEEVVANGKPYDEIIDKVTDLIETEWGYEGIKEDVARIMNGEEE